MLYISFHVISFYKEYVGILFGFENKLNRYLIKFVDSRWLFLSNLY